MLASANAATVITWDKGRITDDTDVSTFGSLLKAYSLASSTETTVNGTTFTGITGSSTSGSSGDGYLSWQRVSGGANFAPGNALGYLGRELDGSSKPTGNLTHAEGLSTNYEDLLIMGLSASGANAGNSTLIEFTFNNLTVGNTYLIQFWTNNSRENLASATDLVFANAGNSSNSISASRNQDKAYGSTGHWVTGTFTAEDTSMKINVTGNQWMNVNAVQIRELAPIPEPTTATLAIVASMGLIARRRR